MFMRKALPKFVKPPVRIKLGGQVMQASLDKGTTGDKQKKTTAKPVLGK
ncbi:hypothetical protein Runsl_5074 [Runella slithyformis DSM 19594]|uniref:Uncharacterized protein n=1 Tax=Runella slithyformis (strain ATCC 29530 / DSM 19594 / LMG 11500 / NCIMB 11436 / LSU 4) TaxID=761193 RepID=A0A7U3ZQ88_RUNSL|nr:hypothetical protein Runsl_5074 [Runella slithyformis DSM 19594]